MRWDEKMLHWKRSTKIFLHMRATVQNKVVSAWNYPLGSKYSDFVTVMDMMKVMHAHIYLSDWNVSVRGDEKTKACLACRVRAAHGPCRRGIYIHYRHDSDDSQSLIRWLASFTASRHGSSPQQWVVYFIVWHFEVLVDRIYLPSIKQLQLPSI